MSRLRIAFAGFQHETNTFMPTRAGIEDFRIADSWPGLVQGAEVITGTRGINLPIAGAIAEAEAMGDVEVVPVLWASAEPSGPVTTDAFDTISGMILQGLRDAGPLDAIYLDLHGAMVTEDFDDGESEILRRVRALIGPDLPIGVSLDLHANLSAPTVAQATVLTIFRTYPHLDMAETGARCLRELRQHLGGLQRHAAYRQVPFLVPLQAQFTGAAPCDGLYAALDDLARAPGDHLDMALGFTAADIPDCGPAIVAYATDPARAEALADEMLARVCAKEDRFDSTLLPADQAVARALALPGPGPVILADVQDNPGAGASADTTGVLRALAMARATDAILGVMHDPQAADAAHAAGPGAKIRLALGGRSDVPGDHPFEAVFGVEALSDGRIPFTGQMYGGGAAEIGPSCLLRLAGTGIQIVVSSKRTQCLDRGLFTHFGLDPAQQQIVVVKSTVHFRADFQPGSRGVINTAAPGGFVCDLARLPYGKLRPGVRIPGL